MEGALRGRSGDARLIETLLWDGAAFPRLPLHLARLAAGADLAGLMAALFPCGSITGAPKIRAMEIIAEVEGRARGVYCGAMGWMAPSGDAVWNVAIRTLSLFDGGRVVLNVGGGVVQDSTADGEWEEALWKARYAEGLATPG